MNNLRKAELLEKAADQIEQRGHWRGVSDLPANGRQCVVTALLDITHDSFATTRALQPLHADLGHRQDLGGGYSVSDVTSWNDSSDGRDVTSRLRKVAGDIRRTELVNA